MRSPESHRGLSPGWPARFRHLRFPRNSSNRPGGVDKLPTADNTHQIAQQLAPESRIVYVDNDPLVLVHARALLTSAPGGMTSYIEADVRDTEEILGEAAGTLDFSQPIALMMLGIMGQLPDSAGPSGPRSPPPGGGPAWLTPARNPGRSTRSAAWDARTEGPNGPGRPSPYRPEGTR